MLSILITHYKRPEIIINCLDAIRSISWPVPFEIVVTDDGSELEVQNLLRTLPVDTLLLSSQNMGLASNLNKGLRACKGTYILYVQEDFMIDPVFSEVIEESFKLLDSGELDMLRYCANYRFKNLTPITDKVNRIPKFSFRNFNVNTFQYSDNPFMTTPEFFERYGFFLEGSSGGYGETEYAMRVLNSKAIIGITNKYYFKHAQGIPSVMDVEIIEPQTQTKTKNGIKRKVWRLARALRQHFEWILYNPKNRRLYTYSNKRTVK